MHLYVQCDGLARTFFHLHYMTDTPQNIIFNKDSVKKASIIKTYSPIKIKGHCIKSEFIYT